MKTREEAAAYGLTSRTAMKTGLLKTNDGR